MKELVEKVELWGEAKGIFKESSAEKQFLKTREEFHEVIDAIIDNDREALIDGIGDTAITLILLSKMKGIDLGLTLSKVSDCSHRVRIGGQIKPCYTDVELILVNISLISKLVGCSLSIGLSSVIEHAFLDLNRIAMGLHSDLEGCIQHSYDIISKRKGKMVNGFFVKEGSKAL
jgi:NTP pyrophosphatase (non-canonical NTP hydrolase)